MDANIKAQMLDRIIKRIEEGDGTFVLSVGNSQDWLAYITLDENPDEMECWGVASNALEALTLMLTGGA